MEFSAVDEVKKLRQEAKTREFKEGIYQPVRRILDPKDKDKQRPLKYCLEPEPEKLSAQESEELFKKYPNSNLLFRLPPNVFVVDIDKPKVMKGVLDDEGKEIMEVNGEEWFTTWQDIDTVSAETRSGGKHFYFMGTVRKQGSRGIRNDKGNKYSIDILTSSPVMFPPSAMCTGGNYAWVSGKAPWDIPIAEAPPSLLAAIAKKFTIKMAKPTQQKSAKVQKLARLLNELDKTRKLDHDCWFKVGCALANESKNSKEGLDAWIEWSKCDEYPNPDKCIQEWNGATLKARSVGFDAASLRKWVQEDNEESNEEEPSAKRHKKDEMTDIYHVICDHLDAVDTGAQYNPYNMMYWGHHRNMGQKSDTREELIVRVAKYLVSVIVYIDASRTVYKKGEDLNGHYARWECGSEEKFLASNASLVIHSNEASVRLVNVYKAIRDDFLWYKDATFRPIVRTRISQHCRAFEHGGHPSQRVFNVFTCFMAQSRIEPGMLGYNLGVLGSPAVFFFHYHMRYVIAAGDERKYKHLVSWHAHIINNPHIKTENVLVVYGKHGAGKSVWAEFLLNFVLGRTHGEIIYREDDAESRFSGEVRYHCLVVMEDHRKVAGKKTGNLKNLATSVFRDEERKNQDRQQFRSYTNVWVISNLDYPVHVEETERRYACFKVSDMHVGDDTYHAAMTTLFRREERAINSGAEIYAHLRSTSANFPIGKEFWTPELDEIRRNSAGTVDNVISWLKCADTQVTRIFFSIAEKRHPGQWSEEVYASYENHGRPKTQHVLDQDKFFKRFREILKAANYDEKTKQVARKIEGKLVNRQGYRLSLEDIRAVIRANTSDTQFEFSELMKPEGAVAPDEIVGPMCED